MKLNSIFLILSILGFTINAKAQIKIHDSGGISIGTTANPGSEKTVIDIPLDVNGDVNVIGAVDVNGTVNLNDKIKIHSGGGISIGSTADPVGDQIKLHYPTTFGSTVTFGGNISSSINPSTGKPYDLGSSSNKWQNLYVTQLDAYYLILGGSGNVKSNLVPYTDNTYSLGMAADQGGPHRWKEVYTYDLFTETIDLDGVDLESTTDGYGGRFYITTSGGDLSFGVGYGSSATIYTSKSYYYFDEEIQAKGIWLDSDLTLKEDVVKIKDTGSSMEKLKDLEGITFKFKEDKDNVKYAGFSAQELQEILPDLVFEDEEGLLSVNYIGLIPYLLEALKEQDTRIDALEKRLKEK